MDDLEIARAALAVNAGVAATLRREFGLEHARSGYKPLVRSRTTRMQELAKIPPEVGRVHVLWAIDAGRVAVEWSVGDRFCHAIVPRIAVLRHRRLSGRRKHG
jgi:hypothetical protein